GHGAMKENYFLDDGAYLVTKLVIEFAKLRLEGKSLTDLIANLKEPEESEEFRIKINTDGFRTYGDRVIEKLSEFAAQQPDWKIVPNNYEGVRVSCPITEENGWFLLRLSLHDPIIPLKVESNVPRGIARMVNRLKEFLQPFEALDLSSLALDVLS
ncbi:MAG: phosphomannomutase/phosphoglucomutase, partial [Snowella sp.]